MFGAQHPGADDGSDRDHRTDPVDHAGPADRDGPVLAVDIGGTKTAAALVDPRTGRLLTVRTAPTPASDGADAVLTGALDLAATVQDAVRADGIADAAEAAVTARAPGAAAPRAIGIASAGVIDTTRGIVTHATDALPGWPGTDLCAAFTARFGAPAAALNDVHAHGLGEARFGAGHGLHSMLLLAVGTGIGGALMLAGHPVTGTRGVAGHIGHIPVLEAEGVPCSCGRTGHLEGLASGPGILRLAARLAADGGEDLGSGIDGRELARRAHAGDAGARGAYEIAGRATGRAVGALLNVLDVDAVVVTGGVADVGAPWWDALTDGVALDAMDVVASTPLIPARAGTHAALLGAAAFALETSEHPLAETSEPSLGVMEGPSCTP